MIDARIGGTLIMLVSAVAASAAPAPGAETDEAIVRAATREGKVVVYAATDEGAVHALLEDFRRSYPGVDLEYHDMNTAKLYERFLSEADAGGGSADVLWSSASPSGSSSTGDCSPRPRSPGATQTWRGAW